MRLEAVACAVVLAFAMGNAAAKNACLVESTLMGEKIKDCTETSMPVPAAEYKSQCAQNADAIRSMGGTATATALPACPAQAQARCDGLFGQKVAAYYYARSAKSLADAKKGCVAQRGKWTDKP